MAKYLRGILTRQGLFLTEAFLLNLDNSGMVNQAIDSSDSHGRISKNGVPITKRLITGNQQTFNFSLKTNYYFNFQQIAIVYYK